MNSEKGTEPNSPAEYPLMIVAAGFMDLTVSSWTSRTASWTLSTRNRYFVSESFSSRASVANSFSTSSRYRTRSRSAAISFMVCSFSDSVTGSLLPSFLLVPVPGCLLPDPAPFRQTLPDYLLVPAVRGRIVDLPLELLRKMVLGHDGLLVIVCVFVPFGIAEIAHEPRGRVADVQGNGQGPRLADGGLHLAVCAIDGV